jgi:MarR family transcriptional regulator for hemolysin
MATKTPTASAKATEAYQLLYRAFTALDRSHERWLANVGSNGARFAVLSALAGNDRPMTPSDVSSGTGRSPNAISPLLRSLQDEGLIKRAANSSDRRSHYLSLTAPGRRITQRLQKEEDAFIRASMGKQSPRDLAALGKTLSSLEEQAISIQRPR